MKPSDFISRVFATKVQRFPALVAALLAACRDWIVAPHSSLREKRRTDRREIVVGIDEFRRMALSLPEATESAHMAHPDFRVRGKIFATLGYPSHGWGVVKLLPDQQELFVSLKPGAFVPAKGAWGARGATSVKLRVAPKVLVRQALVAAWRNTAPKSLVRQYEDGPAGP